MSETGTAQSGKGPRQGRSPAYPFIPLDKALAQAKAFLDAEGKYAVPLPSAFKAWGYGAKSSGGRQTLAALRYFGLIEVEGEGDARKVKLSEPALRVLLDPREDQSERISIIRSLALKPQIHKDLLAQFPDGLASDGSVLHWLMFEKGFNQSGGAELLEQFKATARLAGLDGPATVADKSDGNGGGDPEADRAAQDRRDPPPPPPPPPPQREQRVKVMEGERVLSDGLLSKSATYRVIVSGEVGPKELDRLIAKLKLDRDILADAEDEATAKESQRAED